MPRVMQQFRAIPTLTHALLDHLFGIVLIISPWIMDFHDERGYPMEVPFILGGLLVINSLVTDLEMGVFKWLSVRVHLILDSFIGICLALSPWALDFADRIYLPHLMGGLIISLLPIFTAGKPFDESLYTEVVIKEGRAEVVRYARSTDSSV